jgi:nitroreductase/dihydropteridine reductase
MEILKLLQERHTTKKYDASRKISDADFDLLLESLRLAPSSVNSQPWEFFIADTKEAKEKLLPAIADFNHSRVTDSDRLIVCAIHTDLDETYMQDLDDQEEADGRYQDPAYKVDNGQRRRFFVGKYRDAGEIACWAGKQAYIAQGFLLYTAAALGIHSTPIEGWDADKVDEILACAKRACTPSTP